MGVNFVYGRGRGSEDPYSTAFSNAVLFGGPHSGPRCARQGEVGPAWC